MLKKLMPQEQKFFELLSSQALLITKGIETFSLVITDYARKAELTARIKLIEQETDGLAHRIFQLLSSTFVTPFDREDIQLLAFRMDDVIDAVEKAASRMYIYGFSEPPALVREMTQTLKEAFEKISQAVGMLKNMKNRDAISQLCIDVNSIENTGDALLREALENLFAGTPDPIFVIKAKEIYEGLEEAIDRCEDLANIIETILLKNA